MNAGTLVSGDSGNLLVVNDDGSINVDIDDIIDPDVNNPLPVDGDSVYEKDVWLSESTSTNFTGGDVTDLFNNLHSVIVNSTSNNPKTIFVHFNRTIISNAIGLGAYGGGNFSNVKITILTSGHVENVVIDDSANNTKLTSDTHQFPVTAGFNAVKIEFYTADTVSLSNLIILKSVSNVVRIQAVKPDNTVTDINATAGGNLKMSLEELESGISVNGNSQLRVTNYDSVGTEQFGFQSNVTVFSPAPVDGSQTSQSGAGSPRNATLSLMQGYDTTSARFDAVRLDTVKNLKITIGDSAGDFVDVDSMSLTANYSVRNALNVNSQLRAQFNGGATMAVLQADAQKNLKTSLNDSNGVEVLALSAGADALNNSFNALKVANYNFGFNGGSWDRLYTGLPDGDAQSTANIAQKGLANRSFLYGYNGTTMDRLRTVGTGQLVTTIKDTAGNSVAILANGSDSVSNTQNQLTTSAFGYGYNGITWDRLQVDTNKNLKMSIGSDNSAQLAEIERPADNTGLLRDGLATISVMKAYNGSTIDMLRVDTEKNLNVNINAIDDLANSPFLLKVSKGEITGHTFINKFGQNSDLNTTTYEDVWDGGGTYTYPADGTAPITHIYSTGADTEPIEVQGLDITGALTIQTVTLTGTTVVALTTALWRIFRLKNVGTTDIGLASIVHASDSGKVVSYAQIQNGNNQTLMALYTIPLGKTGYLYQGTNNLSDVTRGVSASGRLTMRQYGSVFQLKKTFGLSSDGSGFFTLPAPIPNKIPALTDIRVSAISSANGVSINTTFDILLIDD